MRSSIKGLISLALLSTGLSVSGAAFAQEAAEEAAPPVTVTGGVTVVTDYRFRGISFSEEDFAVQPTITLTHESGLYFGIWGSNLSPPIVGDVEVDFYAGYATEVAPGATVDVGVTYYYYPDAPGGLNSDYFEPYVSLRGTIGPTTIKVGAAYAFDQAALTGDNIYVYTDLTAAVPDTPVTLVGHIGYSDGSLAFGGNYWDWAFGLDVSFAPFTLGVRYIDTDLDDFTGIPQADTLYDATVLFTVGVSF